MPAFLGAAGFCRPWIAAFAELAKPILNSTHQDQAEPLPWTAHQTAAFEKLKRTLLTAPAPGLPKCDQPFTYTYLKEKEPPLRH